MKDPDQKEENDFAKKLPGWMKKAIERIEKGGVPIPYPDVGVEEGKLKVTGFKVWLRF